MVVYKVLVLIQNNMYFVNNFPFKKKAIVIHINREYYGNKNSKYGGWYGNTD